jgi:hypothetical protein
LVSIDEEVPDMDITEAQVFESETTLVSTSLTKIPGKESLADELAVSRDTDAYTSFKERLTNFWNWKSNAKDIKDKKKEDEHYKTPSLLGKLNKLGTKLQSLKPFETTASPLIKKNKLDTKRYNFAEEDKKYGFSEDDEKDSSALTDIEYQYLIKSRKQFESRYKVHLILDKLINRSFGSLDQVVTQPYISHAENQTMSW